MTMTLTKIYCACLVTIICKSKLKHFEVLYDEIDFFAPFHFVYLYFLMINGVLSR